MSPELKIVIDRELLLQRMKPNKTPKTPSQKTTDGLNYNDEFHDQTSINIDAIFPNETIPPRHFLVQDTVGCLWTPFRRISTLETPFKSARAKQRRQLGIPQMSGGEKRHQQLRHACRQFNFNLRNLPRVPSCRCFRSISLCHSKRRTLNWSAPEPQRHSWQPKSSHGRIPLKDKPS